LFAFRIARKKPVTISLSVNDYGIELLSDQKLPIQDAISNGLPLAFPLMVNRLRAKISSEKLADRIQKMQKALEKAADQKSTGKRVRCRVLANSET
jgi:ATP-dependent Lhr-like helicase